MPWQTWRRVHGLLAVRSPLDITSALQINVDVDVVAVAVADSNRKRDCFPVPAVVWSRAAAAAWCWGQDQKRENCHTIWSQVRGKVSGQDLLNVTNVYVMIERWREKHDPVHLHSARGYRQQALEAIAVGPPSASLRISGLRIGRLLRKRPTQ